MLLVIPHKYFKRLRKRIYKVLCISHSFEMNSWTYICSNKTQYKQKYDNFCFSSLIASATQNKELIILQHPAALETRGWSGCRDKNRLHFFSGIEFLHCWFWPSSKWCSEIRVLGAATKGCGHSSVSSQTSKILNGAAQRFKSWYSSIPAPSMRCGFT